MIRTQVYLDNHQPSQIKVLAKLRKKSESEITREAIERGLKALQKEHEGNAHVFLGLAELGEKLNLKGPTDLSSKIDDYLYGENESTNQ